MSSGLDAILSKHMRFFDVAILPLPLPYENDMSQIDVSIFEALIFGADLPVIVVPTAFEGSIPENRILVAWDDGDDALAAARAALPIARNVSLTDVCVMNTPNTHTGQADPGGRLAQFLTRSGAHIEVTVSAKLQSDVAAPPLKRAAETGAEMIVMGANGHARLRESVMGDATQSMLCQATIPVLTAH